MPSPGLRRLYDGQPRPARRKLHKLTQCSDSLDILRAQESKVFYLDLKRNQRGEYLKIAEKGTNRERSTIIIPAVGLFVAKYAFLSICAPCETGFLAKFTQQRLCLTLVCGQAGIPWFRELFNYYAGGTNEAGCGLILCCSGACGGCRQLTDPRWSGRAAQAACGERVPY